MILATTPGALKGQDANPGEGTQCTFVLTARHLFTAFAAKDPTEPVQALTHFRAGIEVRIVLKN